MSIYGWAHAIVFGDINFQGPDDPAFDWIRIPDVVRYLDDRCKVGDGFVGISSVNKAGDRYVVYVIDCAELARRRGRGRDEGYRVVYRSANRTFGGSSHYDTIEEARDCYDRMRGRSAEQLTLL